MAVVILENEIQDKTPQRKVMFLLKEEFCSLRPTIRVAYNKASLPQSRARLVQKQYRLRYKNSPQMHAKDVAWHHLYPNL